MAPPAKRMKYDASFKLKVVAFAISSNNCAAARKYGVNEKLVRDWKKSEASLKKMPKKKCAARSGIAHWPELENFLEGWVNENRENGYTVTRTGIRTEALKWAKTHPSESKDFKATVNWCSRFMKRKNLVLRQKTKIAQKLPADLEDKIIDFHRYVIGLRKEHDYPQCQIGNMDETPCFFDMLSNKTVDSKGKKTILIKSTGHEKTKFTVVLSCLADGTKLKPMVIFKRKTMPKIKFPPGVFVHVHEKGWMDEGGVHLWIDNVWNRRPGGLRKEKSLLVWDMFRSHLTQNVKKHLQRTNTTTAVIPGGLTSVLQPLDVSLNKPFKDNIRSEWNKWMMDGEKSFTKGGSMRAPPLDVLCDFVVKSWESVRVETVIKSFKKCGISNSMGGEEDDLLWQESEEENSEDSPDEVGSSSDSDPYADLFTSDDEQDLEPDFEGF